MSQPKITKKKSPDALSASAPQFFIDDKAVRALAVILADTDLTEIEYETEAGRIRVSRALTVAPAAATPVLSVPGHTSPERHSPVAEKSHGTPAEEAKVDEDYIRHPGTATSPMVGTAYLSPSPGAQPFIKVGDHVTEGQTLLIIEAMKVMSPFKAPKAGKVVKIYVGDAAFVEFGEPLVTII